MTCRTRVSTRSVLSPVSDFLGTTNGSKRTKVSGVFRLALPRTLAEALASGSTRQASCSSTSTRTCNLSTLPSKISGVGKAPVGANSPRCTLTCSTCPSTGARTVRRSRSVSVDFNWAQACASCASAFCAAKPRFLFSSTLRTRCSVRRCPSSSWYFASAKAAAATCTAAWRVASTASVARESMLKSGSPAFTRLPTSTYILVTTPAISVPTAMFSVLVSTSPTAATVCPYDDAGGGEGGLVSSCFGCERTTEMTPNVSAAIATIGRMNRLKDFQVSRPMSGQPPATKATFFSIITCKHWDGVFELRDFGLVPMTRFGFHNPAIVHVGDGVGVMKDTSVVGYDDDSPIGTDGVSGEQLHDPFACRMVERSGWFVAQNQTRLVHEGASQSHALLLTTGKLARQGVEPIAHPEFHEHRLGKINRRSSTNSGGEERHGRVFRCGQCRQQIILLINEPKILSPKENALGRG